jgi:predicted ATPase
MKSAALGSVRISGLTSISRLSLDLVTPVTVLIGPNGSGKSNLVSAFELLGRIADHQLQEHLVRQGGFSRLLHRSSKTVSASHEISLTVRAEPDEGGSSPGYAAILQHAPQDEAVLFEALLSGRTADSSSPRDFPLGPARESRLNQAAREEADDLATVAGQIEKLLLGCRVFHFQDTSADAPVKQRTSVVDNLALAPDARNLAPVLSRLHETEPATYRRIVRAIQAVAPFFDDFLLVAESGSMLLRWREKGLDNVFSADALSDGTLRFICLATLLMHPERPGTIVLDEPELGLHPFAINLLASLVRQAADDGRKVVLATQSVTLLSHFDVNEVAVVERGTRGSVVNRLDPTELDVWLADYSLGELWEKNVLGGRPRPDSTVPPTGTVGR